MKNCTAKSILLTLALVIASSNAAAFQNPLKRPSSEAFPNSRLGDYRLVSGDSACVTDLTLLKIKVRMSDEIHNAIELVPTEIALDDYIWRKGVSTLFVRINGKEVEDKDRSSRAQAHKSTYSSTYEDNILSAKLEFKTKFSVLALEKKSVETTLFFEEDQGKMVFHQESTDSNDIIELQGCLYSKVI